MLWSPWLAWTLAVGGFFLLGVGLWRLVQVALRGGRSGVSFSLLLVVRNGAEVVEGAVREVVRRYGWWPKDGPSYEVVVVDHGSVDDTPAILRHLARKNPGFIRVARVEPGAATDPVNVGLGLCRGRTAVLIDMSILVGSWQKGKRPRQRTKSGTEAPGFGRECPG